MTEENEQERPVQGEERQDSGAEATGAPRQAASGGSAGGGGLRGLAVAALVLAIVSVLAVALGGWWGWQRYQAFAARQASLVDQQALKQRSDGLDERISELRGRLSSLDERTAGRDQRLAELKASLDAVTETQSQLKAQMDRVAELAQVNRDDWRRSEAAYLARVAVHRLRYYRDVDAALGALKAADGMLSALGGEVIAERKAIRQAIDRLLAVTEPKTDRIASTLAGIADGVDGLRLRAGAEPLPAAKAADHGGEAGGEGARGPLGRAWSEFRGAMGELVVVSGPEREVVPLRPIRERFFLRENLRLQLESARLAAIRGDGALYRDSLKRARDWLSRYYDDGDAAVADALDRLDALADRPVRVTLPDIQSVLAPVREFD
ncbi:hypothetical protein KBTX_00327 [wastewater metagenome]|uniref:Uroporphyrinogen-III C-methyltransferase n=2 Tax=unclassified sequences TaxID=12908 RepID=A0A5B8R620_9ZZZZ|nr:uroporphyrinogen-III C-methyltransferase [Arhodomonas aquaeolei]MCS4505125.1 uroporphyrinogen-III C-methyltransferase [Arhodomonas aquaeolei]QEA04026.1 hypothetical protein KBTEX_00327 [uncultured organism]